MCWITHGRFGCTHYTTLDTNSTIAWCAVAMWCTHIVTLVVVVAANAERGKRTKRAGIRNSVCQVMAQHWEFQIYFLSSSTFSHISSENRKRLHICYHRGFPINFRFFENSFHIIKSTAIYHRYIMRWVPVRPTLVQDIDTKYRRIV